MTEISEVKIDVEVLKEKVLTLTQLCAKMDAVIEKLVDNHERITTQIYNDMQKREDSKDADLKEVHSRITTISRELSDKVELTERRLMDEIKALRADIAKHNKKEDDDLQKLLQWKWMVAGGVVVLAWIIANVKLDILLKAFT